MRRHHYTKPGPMCNVFRNHHRSLTAAIKGMRQLSEEIVKPEAATTITFRRAGLKNDCRSGNNKN
jgi:hypothetical protein